jgi:hypothetical protein
MCAEGKASLRVVVFALAMFATPALSAGTSLTTWLERPDDQLVRAGQPFDVEVHATFDAPLAAVTVQLSAAGEAHATMVARSADPVQPSGLAFISETSQVPFENGLPHDFGSGSPAHDVLLVISEPPFDALNPGDGVFLDSITIMPSGTGPLTISLIGVLAATTRDEADGTPFDDTTVDPKRGTISVFVRAGCDHDSDGDVDLGDASVLQRCFTGTDGHADEPCADTFDDDADGDLDLTDLAVFVDQFTGPQRPDTIARDFERVPPTSRASIATASTADVDGNWGVDERDLVFVRARLGTDDLQADANGDGVVELLDLIAVRNRLGVGVNAPEHEVLRIAEVFPWDSEGAPAWVELAYDTRSGNYNWLGLFRLRIGSHPSYEVALNVSADPKPGYTVLVLFDGQAPPEYVGDPSAEYYDGVIVHVDKPGATGEVFDPLADECLLVYLFPLSEEGEIDRVEWGDVPELHNTLNTVAEPIPEGGSIGRDPIEPDSWRRFPTPTPGQDNGVPPPTPYYPFPEAELASDQLMRFVWLDYRLAEVQYQLQIAEDEAFTAPQIDVTVDDTVHDLTAPLAPGTYYWRVRTRYQSVDSTWSSAWLFTVPTGRFAPPDPTGVDPTADLGTPSAIGVAGRGVEAIPWFATNGVLAPRKDTHMVCLECPSDSGPHAWDAPHVPGHCQHARYHQVHALVATINHYYGGTITQDEISYRNTVHTSPEGNLMHGSAGLSTPSAAREALWLALLVEPDPIMDHEFSRITHGHPYLGFLKVLALPGAAQRPVLIFGYDDTAGPGLERVIFYDPAVGSVALSALATWIGQAYSVLYTPPEPLQTDPRVHNDSDLDGLVDLDDQFRFQSDVDVADTDGDGIGDKTEVWSYTFGKGRVSRSADIDGDGLRAERDSDSDNDGCPDGEEDLNENGTLGFYIAGAFCKDTQETDPFVREEFQMTLVLQGNSNKLAFEECAHLMLMIEDPDDTIMEHATVDLTFDPTLMTFGASGGQEPGTAEVVTGDGYTLVQVCALKEEGTAEITATWYPCQREDDPVTATLEVRIVPYDWIFAVQEEAFLTGAMTVEPYEINTDSQRASGQTRQYKGGGEQTARGHFAHPQAEEPGRWIDAIRLDFGYGADPSHTVLNIDGVPIVNGHTWQRTSEDQVPQQWEIWYTNTAGGVTDLPRYISVRSIGSGTWRRAPLLWWSASQVTAQRYRFMGFTAPVYYVVLRYDRTIETATFFFGEGDEMGRDPGAAQWLAGQDSTQVGFIPVGSVAGYSIRHDEHVPHGAGEGWPPGVDTDGIAVFLSIFAAGKNTCQLMPHYSWTQTYYVPPDVPTTEELAQEIADPPTLPSLLTGFQFKRDYIGAEKEELERRNITPPEYEVELRTEP